MSILEPWRIMFRIGIYRTRHYSTASSSSSSSSSAAATQRLVPAVNFRCDLGETVYALCTGSPRQASVAVWRLSGDRVGQLFRYIAGVRPISLTPRRATLVSLTDPISNTLIDKAICISFPAPNSFTGEDVIEFHTHSSPAVLQHFVHVLHQSKMVREAMPGEFSRRALHNGKMDLMQIEALSDLTNSQTLQQKEQALLQLQGHQSAIFKGWRTEILGLIAHIEAFIDFAEEEDDVGRQSILSDCNSRIDRLIGDIRAQLSDDRRGEIVRDGFEVAIVGECNVGKSSLLNSLMQRDVSIVTPVPGTTRDVIERSLSINGVSILFADTAGFRETDDVIEVEGIRLSASRLHSAQLVIVVMDATSPALRHPEIVDLLRSSTSVADRPILAVNKIDLIDQSNLDRLKGDLTRQYPQFDIVFMSVKQKINARAILDVISKRTLPLAASRGGSEASVVTRARHRQLITQALDALTRFRQPIHIGLDARTEDLRIAVQCLGKLSALGDIHNEEIIDVIFRDFCIGK